MWFRECVSLAETGRRLCGGRHLIDGRATSGLAFLVYCAGSTRKWVVDRSDAGLLELHSHSVDSWGDLLVGRDEGW